MSHLATPDYYAAPSGVAGTWQRVVQVALALDGLLLAAVVIASLVSRSVGGREGGSRLPRIPEREHVVVVGLGALGERIATELHALGVPVVCIDRGPAAANLEWLQFLHIPVLGGEGPLRFQLDRARARTSRAVVVVADDDDANLEALMQVRAFAPKARVVLRLFDDDVAAHVQSNVSDTVARSVSYTAAPTFAAALVGGEVLGTLSVGRRLLFLARYRVDADSPLIGQTVRQLEARGQRRVFTVEPAGVDGESWRPPNLNRPLALGDRYTVIATRSGLALGDEYLLKERRVPDHVEANDADVPTERPERQVTATDEIKIAVYLSDEAHGETVRSAVMAYLRAVGAEITEDGEPVIGSWSWFARARRLGKAAAQSQTAHNAGTLAESAAWGPVRSRQADINLVNSQAVANLVQSLAGSPSGLVLIGSLLAVKNSGVPIVVMLSQEQVNALERRPALLSQPESILEDLQRIRAESAYAYDDEPPALTG